MFLDVSIKDNRFGSIYELQQASEVNYEAQKVLLNYLKKDINNDIKEYIVTCLSINNILPEIKTHLFSLYEDEMDKSYNSSYGWVLSNALSIIMTEEDLERILEYILTYRSINVQLLVLELKKYNKGLVTPTILKLCDNPVLYFQIMEVIRKHRIQESLPLLQSITTFENTTIQRNIERTIEILQSDV